jgi:isocitrate lyase
VEAAINASDISDKRAAYEGYISAVEGKSNTEARVVASDILGKPVSWDSDGS